MTIHAPPLVWLVGLTLALTSGCAKTEPPDDTGFAIRVAPFSAPGITDTCYRVTVTNGPDRTGDVVWQHDLCADQYGDGVGSLAYVGPCDGGVTTQNSVTLELLDLKIGAPITTAVDDDEYANPCGEIADWSTASGRDALLSGEDPYGPCTINKTCLPNRDVPVDFKVTVMRDAHQGFFDVAVEFDDIFCSAKLDCTDELLFNAQGKSDTTAIVAFACTAGEHEETFLHLSDLYLTCVGSGTSTEPIVYQLANGTGPGQHGPVRSLGANAPGVFQWATYQGDEHLTSNGNPLEKCFWNRAVGLDLQSLDSLGVTSCSLTAIGTASDTLDGFNALAEPGTSYPIIRWNVPVYTAANPTTGAPATLCGNNPLDGNGSGVTTEYVTSATDPATLLPITSTMACGTDVIQCQAGPDVAGTPDDVIATQVDATTLAVTTGGQTTNVSLTGALAGFTLGSGCHQDDCCGTSL